MIKLNMFEFYAIYPLYVRWGKETEPSTEQIEAVYSRGLHGKSLNLMEKQEVIAFIDWIETNACKEDLEELKSTIQYIKGILNVA